MKMRRIWLALAAGSLILSPFTHSFSAQESEHPPGVEPSEQHKLLARDVGTWTADMKIYMQGPDKPPVVLPVKEVNRILPGGLWMVTVFDAGPFKGHGQFGYDPIKKKYVGTWIDSMNPHMATMEGDVDKTGKMVMYMKSIDPATNKKEDMKSVAEFKDNDNKVFTMYKKDEASGKWVLAFEITYKRSK